MLHHVEINVSNLKRSIDFWDWILVELGYSIYQRWPNGISWKQGKTYLVLVQTEDTYLEIPYHRKRVGLNHIAFHANSKQQLDEMTMRLEDKEITILYQDKHPFAGGEKNHYVVFFEDPDRIKVEIVAP